MTKADAFDILAGTIKDLCVTDTTYSDNPSVNQMVAILSEIDATVNTLFNVFGKEKNDEKNNAR